MTLTVNTATKPDQQGELIPKWLEFMSKDNDRMAQVLAHAQVGALATTTTNDTGEVADLADLGLELKDDHFYEVRIDHFAATDNDFYFQRTTQWVKGRNTAGGDPVLCGDPTIERAFGVINGSVVKYGDIKYKAAVASGAVTEAGDSASGVTLGDFTTGSATLTLPANRLAACKGVNFAAATYSATTGAVPHVEVTDASTSGTVELADPDDGGLATNPADGVLTMNLEIWPPTNAFLSVNGTPDPGAVEVHVLGIGSDTVYHDVKVYVSEGVYLPATTGSED